MDLIEKNHLQVKRHPWELARCDFFLRRMETVIQNHHNYQILDVGSGDAWFAEQILTKFNQNISITCWDKEYDKKEYKNIKDNQNIQYISQQPTQQFDLILMLDVLEHIQEDGDFLQKIREINLKDDGTLIISVPVWSFLYGPHDQFLKHYRRYNPIDIKKLCEKTNLKIIEHGGIFSSLLIFRIIEMFIHKMKQDTKVAELNDYQAGNLKTNLIRSILDIDAKMNYLLSKIKIDCLGLSWWAICKQS